MTKPQPRKVRKEPEKPCPRCGEPADPTVAPYCLSCYEDLVRKVTRKR
jgi:NMD protein affecting ribosome stability and mRNA decay